MRTSLGLLVFACFAALPAYAEKVDMSPAALRKTATHVVTGTVKAVYERVETVGSWRTTRRVAEVAVATAEKGAGLRVGGLVYARYWTRAWIGGERMPPSTTGHRGLPTVGETLRIYLARNAYDGFGATNDGGFNVLGANGFERLPAQATR